MNEEIHSIPEFGVNLVVKGNILESYDHDSGRLLDRLKTTHDIIRLNKLQELGQYRVTFNKGRDKTLQVNLLGEKDVLDTQAEYILSLEMTSPSHGYYFGTYEVGEFKLTEEFKLIKIRHFLPEKNTYLSKGVVTPENKMFVAVRNQEEGETKSSYFLGCIDWQKEPLQILWKKPLPAHNMASLLLENELIIGLKDGSLQRWDIHKDTLLDTISLFSSSVSQLLFGKEKILATSWEGEVAALSSEGELLWKEKVSDKAIYAIMENEEGIQTIDHGGVYRLIDSQRQIIPKKLPEELNQSIYSNLICFREWFIVYDGMGIQGYCNKYSEILSYPNFDPYIRSFHTHPYGVFTGDDEGKIRFCVLGKLSLERSYEPD